MKLTPHDFKLYVKQQARKIVAEQTEGQQQEIPGSLDGRRHLDSIISKMQEMQATSVSDEEIIRCLKDTVAAKGLIRLAKKFRDEGYLTNDSIHVPHQQDINNNEDLGYKHQIPAYNLNGKVDNSFVSEMFGFSKSNTNKKPAKFSTQDFRDYILSEAMRIVAKK